jgi:hypothetical protein
MNNYILSDDLEEIKDTLTYLPYMICFHPKPPYEICEHVLMLDPNNIEYIQLKEENPDYNKILELYRFLTL